MDTQTQIDRLIELAIIQRSELKQLVEQLPQLREHLNTEVEKVFDETEPQLRAELEEWTTKQTADKTAALGVALEAKIADLAKSLEVSTQARYNAIIAEREENAHLAAQAEAKIAEHAASLPSAVKEIVSAELARFPRAGEIDQLRKEFAEPRGLNPRGKWQAGETYNKLDFVTINGDSYASNIDNNRTRPSRSSADWTLVAARGTGGGGGPTSLSELTTVPSDGDLLIGSGTSWVTSNLTAGAGISITVGPGAITISATDGDITLDDGTAASPSLHFTNDPDTGIYRPAANTLGISVSGTQVAYFDENGLTVPSAGVVAGGSFHGANGNANNPSYSFSGDQDTGFFRHQPNEIGVSLGGTQKATLTSTTFTITPNLVVSGTGSINGTSIPASKTLVVTTDKLSALASTSSAELAGVISDETGTGSLVFANTPTLTTPNIGAATGTSFNLTGSGTLGTTLTVNGTTDSSSKDTGAIVTEGGLGVEKSATFGGNLTVGGTTTLAANTWLNSSDGLNRAFFLSLGTTYYKGHGSGVIHEFRNASDTAAFQLTNALNGILSGNLTVSGTDYNYVGGNKFFRGFTNYNVLYTGATELSINNQADGANLASFKNNGNFLIGTAVDSSALLQVGTNTTTAAGGMKFGTDTSLYRLSNGGNIALDGAFPALSLYYSGTQKAYFYANNSNTTAYIGSASVGWKTVIMSANNVDALTLDSSQNATFAGTIALTGSSAGQVATWNSSNANGIYHTYLTNGTAIGDIGSAAQAVSGSASDFGITSRAGKLVLGTSSSARLTIDTTGNATFTENINAGGASNDADIRLHLNAAGTTSAKYAALWRDSSSTKIFHLRADGDLYTSAGATITGAIAIGNTVNNVSPTSPNRTITMVIGGTTYYIHAKTTND